MLSAVRKAPAGNVSVAYTELSATYYGATYINNIAQV